MNDVAKNELNLLDIALVESNISTLNEGAKLISLLEDGQYTQGFKPAFQSTIGAHFRHVLEHYRCFESQQPGATFCYDLRERDQLLECDSEYALNTINELIAFLETVSDEMSDQIYYVEEEQTSKPVATSLNRELLFLQSHTVHHYAIIAAMTRAFGNQPEEEFGVAIATRTHNEKCAEKTKPTTVSKGGAICAQ